MKKLFYVLIILIFTATPAMALLVTLGVDHDANTEPDLDLYRYFYRFAGEEYDYTQPWSTDCTVTGGVCVPTGFTWGQEGNPAIQVPDGELTIIQVIARAQDTGGLQSGDSNEVELRVDLRPLPAPILTGVYNEITEQVDLVWTQNWVGRVNSWKVFIGDASGGPWTEHETVENTGQTEFTSSVPIVAPPGEVTTKYFTVVGYTDWGIFSPNSNVVEIVIDKDEPPASVINLHITVTNQ